MDCSHEGVCTKGHQIAAQLPYVISRTIEWRRIEGISAAEGNLHRLINKTANIFITLYRDWSDWMTEVISRTVIGGDMRSLVQ